MRRPTSYTRLFVLLVTIQCALCGCQTTRWQGPKFAPPMAPASHGVAARLLRAESAYDTATHLEAAGDQRCVDAYFEATKSSWCEVHESLGRVDATSVRAWQLHHSSLAKLICNGKRFGRLHPTLGLEIWGPQGRYYIAVKYREFLWRPEDFNEFVLVGKYSSDQLLTTYRCPGLGVPLLVKRKRNCVEPMRRKEQLFGATVVLRQTLSDGTDPSFALEFSDPVRVAGTAIGDRTVALRRELSAPYAYRASTNTNLYLEAFRLPGSTANDSGLYAIEPYQPGKIPVIFIHGLLSDPSTWITMVNELRANPEILQNYQFWAFEYPTGEPFARSALTLRKNIAEAIDLFDPERKDPALSKMVLIGHSMGGLVAKLQITSSRTYLWDALANRPFDQIVGADETLTLLSELVFFEPQPAVQRVIFIATPHRGAGMAQRLVGRVSSALVEEPESRKAAHRCLIENNPGVFSSEFRKRIPTSIDMLEPESCILQAVERLPIASDVALHSIIGDNGKLLGEPTDGVVPVKSARHSGVRSELFVCAEHTKIQSKPQTIEEVLRILLLHAQTSDIGPTSDSALPNVSVSEQQMLEEPGEDDSPMIKQINESP